MFPIVTPILGSTPENISTNRETCHKTYIVVLVKGIIKIRRAPASCITIHKVNTTPTFNFFNIPLPIPCSPYAMLYIPADTGIPGLGPWSGHDPGLITHRYHYWLSHLLPSQASTHAQPTCGSLRGFLLQVKYTGFCSVCIIT